MNEETPLWSMMASQEGIEDVASRLTESLRLINPFCLWLVGEMGSGKTTLSGAILRGLGLPPKIPVTSPTYTYVNEYEINGRLYAHMDLYRVGPAFNLEELGLLARETYQGLIIEWPERASSNEDLASTHRLHISYLPSTSPQYNEARNYEFYVDS